jgi:fimbrial chaperone protein
VPRFRPRFPKACALFLGLAICQAENVFASAYKVTPIQVVLSGKTSSALLTLTNESPETLRFQLSAFAWSQSPQGEMQLAPTDEVLFFPVLLSIGPGEERKVRVGATARAGSIQKTYRIFFEELPPPARPEAEVGSQVRLLTKMGIPIFLNPASPASVPKLESLAVGSEKVSFRLRNAGNAHFMAQLVRVTGVDARGEKTFERDLAGWYVLAGGERLFETGMSAEDCQRTRSVAVEVQTETRKLRESSAVSAGACRSGG